MLETSSEMCAQRSSCQAEDLLDLSARDHDSRGGAISQKGVNQGPAGLPAQYVRLYDIYGMAECHT